MGNKTAPLLPFEVRLLADFGERLKLARLRRKLTAKLVAERAGMSQMTLRSVESGGSGVTIGAYLAVMRVLGMEQDIMKLAADDELGRQLQDARMVAGGGGRSATVNANVTDRVRERDVARRVGPQAKTLDKFSPDKADKTAASNERGRAALPLNTMSLAALIDRRGVK